MYAGLSPKDIYKNMSKGGILYERYRDKELLVGLLYLDIDKERSKRLVSQFFDQLHYTSADYVDMYWVGYRTDKYVDKTILNDLREVKEINIKDKGTPHFFDSRLFHRENNMYLRQPDFNKKLGNSSCYALFFDTFDGEPNLDNAYVVNFIKGDEKEDFEFMNKFVSKMRNVSSKGVVSIESIEEFLGEELRDRIFKIVKKVGSSFLTLL